LAVPLFELTRKDVAFVWDSGCQSAFEALKGALVAAPVLTRPNFEKPFCLDVDWSPKGVGAILSQKESRMERVVAYASKGLTTMQKKFHPMEGECYALIWGIMHFRQYLHRTHFVLRTDHKPLEWLATVSDAHGRRGRWIDMLQDFSFKIVHRPGMKHVNVDALSRNLVGDAKDDDDFSEEIQDIGLGQGGSIATTGSMFSVQCGRCSEWFGMRRQSGGRKQHYECCFGINHWLWSEEHQLCMIDVLTEASQDEEDDSPEEGTQAVVGEEVQNPESSKSKQILRRGKTRYYDRKQQLELVLAAQGLLEDDEHETNDARPRGEEAYADDISKTDIWEDAVCMGLLKEGFIPDTIDLQESKRTRKRATHYCWKDEKLYFKGLYMPKPKDRLKLVTQMHEDLGHFGEQRTLIEICQRYFWKNRTECVKAIVKTCRQCQLVKSEGSIRSGDERLKSIPICDLFYQIALDTAGPLPETKAGNKYILVAIDHYSKWCEAKAVADHGAKTTARFLEDDLICRYRVPKFVLTDNGGEWGAEFEVMCRDYVIQHQRTTPQWPQCNGMAERMIKTLKHGITILASNPANVNCWDEHLAKVLFGYRCGVQASTKFSPFMIMTGRSPRLRADNYLDALTNEVDDTSNIEDTAVQFLEKVRLIASIHESVLLNVEQAQKKQRNTYANRPGKHLFEGLVAGVSIVKMKKLGKRRALSGSWEGPYQFVGHADGKGNFDFEEGCRICIVQDADGRQWERSRRDLQIYCVPPD
jgi:hypothetical protein